MRNNPADHAQTLNLAILGYGKMGRTIAQLAPERGFDVRLIMDVEAKSTGILPPSTAITPANFRGIDVCIEFTEPKAVLENIRRVAAAGCNLVVGTTGWHNQLDEVRKIVESSGIGMVYAANFSIGVNLFYRLARQAAEMFAAFPIYDPYLTEAHHKFKKDAPSGTALEIKRQVQPAYKDRAVPVSSTRAGYIPGVHELGFDSEADTVILRHTARSRQGFAEGALFAARWVVGKKGLFDFADVLERGAGD
ncbi:MAG: 4-hydroxy-tetrahydrodipicolinate reductase [Terriglobia bacterium]